MSDRGERRHHEERVKAKWRRRIRREANVADLTAFKAPPPAAEVEARAVRRAHHNKCDCAMCKPSLWGRRVPSPRERITP